MTVIQDGCLVRSTAGRDGGRLYLVWGSLADIHSLVDGKTRRISNPKQKRAKHLELVLPRDDEAFETIRSGIQDGSADAKIRRLLRSYKRNKEEI